MDTALFRLLFVGILTVLGSADAWNIKSGAPAHVTELCLEVKNQLNYRTHDPVLNSLELDFRRIDACKEGYSLWFWESESTAVFGRLHEIRDQCLQRIEHLNNFESRIVKLMYIIIVSYFILCRILRNMRNINIVCVIQEIICYVFRSLGDFLYDFRYELMLIPTLGRLMAEYTYNCDENGVKVVFLVMFGLLLILMYTKRHKY
jgi:hypothetical protein